MSSSSSSLSRLVGSKINSYTLLKVLGSGASGTVFLASHLYRNEKVAIKVVPKYDTDSQKLPMQLPANIKARHFSIPNESSYEIYKNHFGQGMYKEIMLHTAVHGHANILSILELLDSDYYLCIVLEYCNIGDLFYVLTEQNWYIGNESIAKELLLQLIDAVEYCHSRSVYHCDLKPENIMVSNNGACLKLADFGLASSSPLSNEFGRGSSYYMSPENIANNVIYQKKPAHPPISRRMSDGSTCRSKPTERLMKSKGYPKAASDVWALGIIFLNLLFGRNPWKTASVVKDTAYRDFTQNYNTLKEILPISEELNQVLMYVFHPDPYRRLSISSFRQKVLECDILIDREEEFSWFKRQDEYTALPRKSLVPHVVTPNVSESLLDENGVVIENLKDHSINFTVMSNVKPTLTCHKVKAAGFRDGSYPPSHIPGMISPPLSDCTQFSDCSTVSTEHSVQSIGTGNSVFSSQSKQTPFTFT